MLCKWQMIQRFVGSSEIRCIDLIREPDILNDGLRPVDKISIINSRWIGWNHRVSVLNLLFVRSTRHSLTDDSAGRAWKRSPNAQRMRKETGEKTESELSKKLNKPKQVWSNLSSIYFYISFLLFYVVVGSSGGERNRKSCTFLLWLFYRPFRFLKITSA